MIRRGEVNEPETHEEFAFWEKAFLARLHQDGPNGARFQAGIALGEWLRVRGIINVKTETSR